MAENITLSKVRVKHKVVDLNTPITDALQGELFLSELNPSTTDAEGNTIPAEYVMQVGTDTPDEPAILVAPASDVASWAKSASFDDAYNTSTSLKNTISALYEAAFGGGAGGGTSLPDQLNAINQRLSDLFTAFNGSDDTKIVTGFVYTPAKPANGSDPAVEESFEVTYGDSISDFATQGALEDVAGDLSDHIGTLAVKINKKDAEGNDIEGEFYDQYENFSALSDAFYTFMHSQDISDNVIDTLIEINNYITEDTDAFTTLSGNVQGIRSDLGSPESGTPGQDGYVAASGLFADIADINESIGALDTHKDLVADFLGTDFSSTDKTNTLGSILTTLTAHAGTLGTVATFNAISSNSTSISTINGTAVDTLILDCN